MKKLADLFAEMRHLPIQEQKDYIRLRLPQILSAGQLNLWRLGDPVRDVSRRVLIGIATWSLYDLSLLDFLIERPDAARLGDEQIDVFDLDDSFDPQTPLNPFEKCIPGIGRVVDSPVIGIWENGVLSQKATGAEARKLVADRYK